MSFLLTMLLAVAPAYAGAVLVGTAPLPADGATTSEVHVYLEKCGGSVRARVKAESGKVAGVTTGADCVVTFSYTPPSVSAAKTLPVTVQAQSEEYTVQVPVVPPFAGDVAVTFDPPVIAAGGTATIKVKPSGTSPVAVEQRRFALTASVGTVDPPVPLGDGTYAARYTAPAKLTGPVMVAVTVADAAAPAIQGWAGLPVTVKQTVTFDAPSASVNVLTLGGKKYGPFKADTKNHVAFEVELDPRQPVGHLQTVNTDTSKAEKDVPMPNVPQQGQLVFLPMPASVVANPSAPLPVRVLALAPTGEAVSASDLKLTASAGTIGAPGPDGKVMAGLFTSPASGQDITLTANWNGLVASRKLRVLNPLPTMTLAADPADLPKGGGSVKVVARLKDAGGTALAGRAPTLVADGGTMSGKVADNKDGTYGSSVSGTSKTERIRVYGTPPMDVSSLAPARILAWAGSPSVTGNGLDGTAITLVAVDAYDLPVPNVEFKLSVPKGDGVLPPSVKADARGIAHATYKAGTTAGLQTLHIEGGGLWTEIPVFQVGQKQFLAPAPGGGAAHLAALERWQHASPTLTVVREGVIPPSGPPADMQISTTPGYTTPGAAILVQVRINDDNGVGVAGQKLQVSAGGASIGPITDGRDGTYSFTAQLAAGKDGPLKVTVAAGTAITSLELGTLEQAGGKAAASASTESRSTGGGGGFGGFGGGSSGGGSSTTVNKPRPAPVNNNGGEPAAGRFGGGLVNLRGPYASTTTGGGLAGASLDSPGTGFWGLAVQGHYGLPVGDGRLVFGANGRFSANIYDVNGESFLVILRDITAGGRYLHPVADGLRAGGGLDIQSLSAPYFQYTDESRQAAELAVGSWFGVRVAGQLDVDLPSDLHASVDLAETFAWAPAATHAGALVDIPLGSAPAAIRLGLAWDWHYFSATTLGGDEGTGIDEHIMTAQVGAVYVLR